MKVIELIKSLSSDELKYFIKFIKSPYFNENKDIILLLESFIIKAIGSQSLKNSKQNFILTYKWSDAKFRKHCNDLLELLIEFITIEKRKTNNFKNQLESYKSILSKEWSSKLKNKLNQIKQLKLEKYSWTEIELAEFYIFLKSQIDSDLFSPEEALIIYAEIAQIKKEFLRCSDISSFLDLNNLEQANYHLNNEIFKNINPITNELYPIYKNIKSLFEGKEYKPLLQKITEELPNIKVPFKTKYRILIHCIGYMTTLLNKGDIRVNSQIFDLYKFGIENDLLLIEVIDYRNISYFACQAKEFEWALNFVEKYKSKLPIEDQESAYSFTKARTLWYAKDWDGVLRTLRNVEYNDMTYNLMARSIILTCYYELDDFDPLDSLIKSFKVYLRRKRNVSKARKESFYNFISALDHLMKASERNDHRRIQKAKDLIQENPSTRNKDWLNEKIEELEAIIKPSKK